MRLIHTIVVVIVAAFLAPMLILGVTAYSAMKRVDERAGEQARTTVHDGERARLERLAREQALELDRILSRQASDVVSLQALYEHGTVPASGDDSSSKDLYPDEDKAELPGYGYVHPKYGAYADWLRRGPDCPWLPRRVVERVRRDPGYAAAIRSDLERVRGVSSLLREIGERRKARLDLVWIVLASGASNVYPPYDYLKLVTARPELPDLDESEEDYVRLVNPANNPARHFRWLEPYFDPFKGVWMTSVVAPLYEGERFLGSVGMDLLLRSVTDRIMQLGADPGEEGYAFLLASHGKLVAAQSSGLRDLALSDAHARALQRALEEPPGAAWTEDEVALVRDGSLLSSNDSEVRSLAEAMMATEVGEREVRFGNVDKLVAFARVPSADWSLAMVVPSARVLAPAEAIRQTIHRGTTEVIGNFLGFFFAIAAASVLVGFVLHYLTIRPLTQLTDAVATLQWDDLELRAPLPKRRDEIGRLHRKFQDMIAVIRRARDEVTAKSDALEQANRQLSASNADLARENGERVRAEQKLAHETQMLAVTLRSIGDGIIVTNGEGAVTMMNRVAEQLTGWSEADATGRPLDEVFQTVDEQTGAARESPVDRVLETGRIGGPASRTMLVGRDGTPRAIADSGAPIRDANGEPVGLIIVFRDITDARRLEDEMARVQKLETVKVLAAGIAHDFNNLLAAVLGYTSLARQDLPAESETALRLGAAEKAIGRARELTQQLLTFSSGGEPVRRITSLATILHDAAGFALRGATSRCDVDAPRELWPVNADAGQIGQVVQNLVLNADEAMAHGGVIRIEARNVTLDADGPTPLPAGRYVEVAVHDRGPGIAREILSRIFDPFFTTKARGSGLGLAVCFSIIRKHLGHIEAISVPSRGATFRFWLPAAGDEAAAERAAVQGLPSGTGRILVMDDEAAVREVSSLMLRELGYDVVAARDGDEAIRLYQEARATGQPFDAVILDLTIRGGMGGKDAVEVLRRIEPAIRAIVSSGYSNDPVLSAPDKYGFCATIRKPYDLETLAAVVASVVAGSEARS